MNAGNLGLAVFAAALSSVAAWRLCSSTSVLARLDHPNDRSLHTQPTPRTGGLAILGSVLAGLLAAEVSGWTGVLFWNSADLSRATMWLWVLGLTLVIGVVSFWDDRGGLPPSLRFCLHGVTAIGVVWGGGVLVTAVPLPLIGTWPLGILAAPLTVLGLMWMANLYNFMDGMDGLAGGMTVFGFSLLGYLASSGGASDLALVAWLIGGGAAGFLVFNLPPARIFMGDVGSVPLGFLAGALTVIGVRDGVFDLWVPLLIFSPFVADATVTLFCRLLRGVKVWQAHREHYYQRVVLAGWGHRKTMLAEYALMLASGATAMLYVNAIDPVRFAILIFWLVGYVVLAWGVRTVELKGKSEVTNA